MFENLLEMFIEEVAEPLAEAAVPLIVGAAAGIAAAFVGYEVYKITVKVIDRYSLKAAIKNVLMKLECKKQNASFSAVIKDITEKGSVKELSVSVLDDMDKKVCVAKIEGEAVYGLKKGDVVEGICV